MHIVLKSVVIRLAERAKLLILRSFFTPYRCSKQALILLQAEEQLNSWCRRQKCRYPLKCTFGKFSLKKLFSPCLKWLFQPQCALLNTIVYRYTWWGLKVQGLGFRSYLPLQGLWPLARAFSSWVESFEEAKRIIFFLMMHVVCDLPWWREQNNHMHLFYFMSAELYALFHWMLLNLSTNLAEVHHFYHKSGSYLDKFG